MFVQSVVNDIVEVKQILDGNILVGGRRGDVVRSATLRN
jgi:hypothetical protein